MRPTAGGLQLGEGLCYLPSGGLGGFFSGAPHVGCPGFGAQQALGGVAARWPFVGSVCTSGHRDGAEPSMNLQLSCPHPAPLSLKPLDKPGALIHLSVPSQRKGLVISLGAAAGRGPVLAVKPLASDLLPLLPALAPGCLTAICWCGRHGDNVPASVPSWLASWSSNNAHRSAFLRNNVMLLTCLHPRGF